MERPAIGRNAWPIVDIRTAEVELVPGEVIDTHAPDNPFGKEEVSVYLRRVTRTREYALDEPVIIEASDFFEIAMACYLFAADVATKLPTSQGTASTAPGAPAAAE